MSSITQYNIYAFTETWCHDGIKNSELFDLNAFDVYRCDRNFDNVCNKRGGGVLFAILKELNAAYINIDSICDKAPVIPNIDILMVKIKINFHFLYLLVIYIPPSCKNEDYEATFELLLSLHCIYGSDLLIMGDFNIPEYLNCSQTQTSTTNFNTMQNFLNLLGLTQFNNIVNNNGRLLDLVLSNRDCIVTKASELILPEDCHHPALSIETDISKPPTNAFSAKSSGDFNFKKANYFDLYDDLASMEWVFLDQHVDVNSAVADFYNVLNTIIEKHVPKKKLGSRSYPPWFNGQIIHKIKLKAKFWTKYKRARKPNDLTNFKLLRAQIKDEITNSYKTYIRNIESDLRSNPNKFWTYINSKNNKSSIPPVMTYNNETIDSPQEIVDSFADFFSKSFNPTKCANYTCNVDHNSTCLNITCVSEEDVSNAIKKLKASMIMGPDMIPAFLIRDCSPVFCIPLAKIFNLILRTSCFPDIWKLSRVCPIYKKGERHELTNYRPITIICNFPKILEILLHMIFLPHVSGIISGDQHGFMRGRSTVTNLVCKSQFICEKIDQQSQVDVIYTDFSKAFDRLDHGILLQKLDLIGFSDALVDLISSYLDNRYQFVQYRGYKSVKFLQKSGVPQGSILGPLLFIIFINDIVSGLEVNYLLYADDLKLYSEIQTIADCERLQKALESVSEWCISNCLPLNISKCNVMTFSKKINYLHFEYVMDGIIIQRPNYIKDLGVTFDPKLNFIKHIELTISSACINLGFILRNSKGFTDMHTLRLLYISFVRSRLEYASIVWSPIYNNHIMDLEKIQRRFLKSSSFILDKLYPPRGFPHDLLLARFELVKLENRRAAQSVIFLFKLINNKIDCIGLSDKISYLVPRISSRHNNILYISTPRTNTLTASPLYRMNTNYSNVEDDLDIFFCNILQIRKCFSTI